MKTYPPTPELDRMRGIHDKSQAIGEFLDWLSLQGIHLCRWRDKGNNGEPRYIWKRGVKASPLDREPGRLDEYNGDATHNPAFEAWGDGYVADHTGIEKRLAQYFEIDLNKCETERRSVLEFVRREA